MINPIHPIFYWSPFPFACLFRYLAIMIYDPPVQEVHLVWVVGRSMETIPWFGHEKLLYRRQSPVQESLNPESISCIKKKS